MPDAPLPFTPRALRAELGRRTNVLARYGYDTQVGAAP